MNEPCENPTVTSGLTSANASTLGDVFSDARAVLVELDAAMRAEGATPEFRQRVTNRLVWGDPEGAGR